MRVLGIESSCDDSAAAVVEDGPRIVSNVIDSQDENHDPFGGVVPEIASREHVTRIVGVVRRALDEAGGLDTIDGIAVTRGPGLVGSLLVGVQFAKGLAIARGLPWVGINHLEGHLSAALLADEPPTYPHVALVVSGGHSHLYWVEAFGRYRVLGGTRDDAAGEAFDKIGKLMGLGYPGGARLEKAAEGGDPKSIPMPRGLPSTKSFDFSFSGLKTAAAQYLRRHDRALEGRGRADFAASVQEAIVDILSKKAVASARKLRAPGVVLAGGVAANTRLRELMAQRCAANDLWSFVPPRVLCTDNAAMIAAVGWLRLRAGERTPWTTSVRSRWPLGDDA
ncbi:MAG: tRNA (adenosine(37)-N6)-threonylcarbamoyltransferase complex transferase subunit TsaD [Myxococcota bacterium]